MNIIKVVEFFIMPVGIQPNDSELLFKVVTLGHYISACTWNGTPVSCAPKQIC